MISRTTASKFILKCLFIPLVAFSFSVSADNTDQITFESNSGQSQIRLK
jgi:hypothetical protein